MIDVFGDDALSVCLDEPQDVIEARAQALRLEKAFAEIVPTVGRLTVVFDPTRLPRDEARRTLAKALARTPATGDTEADALVLPAVYDGPDLDRVADSLGIEACDVGQVHAVATYTVQFLGFTPGFAYLGGLPPVLCGVDRLAEPRTKVPAGSIGVTGDRSGVYALAGPGGWPIIGRTTKSLFAPGTDEPFALRPGQRVRFEPVR